MSNVIENLFPEIFCVEDIQYLYRVSSEKYCRVALYHDLVCVTVEFDCGEGRQAVDKGCLVSVDWLPDTQSEHGAIQVVGLMNASFRQLFLKNFNPFLTVPRSWEIDRNLIDFSRKLWGISSRSKRKWLFDFVLSGYVKKTM